MNDVTTATTTTAATAANTAANTGTTAAPAWYEGKVEAATLGFWQRKGIDLSDPIKVASALTEQYSNAEKLIGVPADELIRMPKANAAETDIKAFWNRIGVPLEAKDYDLSSVKRADGKEIDAGLVDTMRAALHEGRVPKDRAAGILSRLVKQMESTDTAKAAELTASVQEQQATLDKNWGTNKPRNLIIANDALARVGQAAGLTPEQIKQGWDALSKVGGIGASYAMEMLRVIGERAIEPTTLVTGGQGGSDPALLSREAAAQEIDMLKRDQPFREKLLAGDRESRRRWDNLHKAATGQAA